MITKKTRRSLFAWGGLGCVGLALLLLLQSGVLWFNMPSKQDYPIEGVDVSHYQGEIDWTVLASQNQSFAFLKATEGSGTVDACFAKNWAGARAAGLAVGAYHFFSFDSPGKTQAENFIATVPVASDALPPVIDLEFYRKDDLPSKEAVQAELAVLLETLRDTYGKTPIFYTTNAAWDTYLKDSGFDYLLWIRSIFTPPSDDLTPAWTFWQYNPKGRLDGYAGEERFIDRNVFCGSAEAFAALFG